jgi:hypothetical protein
MLFIENFDQACMCFPFLNPENAGNTRNAHISSAIITTGVVKPGAFRV